MHLSSHPGSLGCCPFYGGGSVVVDIWFNVLTIGGSVFVFVFGMHLFVFVLVLRSS